MVTSGIVVDTFMKTFLALFIAMLIVPASARIGETPEQLVVRYGKSKPGKDVTELTFEKNGLAIVATLWKGVCHSIRFLPVKPAEEAGRQLTRDEIQLLLTVNSGGVEWFENKKNSWISVDAKLSAFIFSDGALCIVTADFIAHDMASRKKDSPERTDGF